ALRSLLTATYPERLLVFIFGAMRDKAIDEMAQILFPLGERVLATHANSPRAATPEQIQEAAIRTGANVESLPDVGSALNRAREITEKQGVIVVTGSIYVVGEALQLLSAPVGAKA
ncbi:MAG: bifunctional folylpolyglutamate synthase/dihydrofolate synthase, partial [Acidobacteriales bacterium]|nr:bifunctional folylpolyglutamate synthase/dihydrofolate synthase [Terriglobales bacterium]